MIALIRTPKARADLLDQFEYLEGQGGVELAGRYWAAVDATCQQLAAFPLSGVSCHTLSPLLQGIRRVPVTDFPNYLIFYRVLADCVEIVRVLHGARDINAVLLEL